jgi:hypothetical protein
MLQQEAIDGICQGACHLLHVSLLRLIRGSGNLHATTTGKVDDKFGASKRLLRQSP